LGVGIARVDLGAAFKGFFDDGLQFLHGISLVGFQG
jgi:hypothetical protein